MKCLLFILLLISLLNACGGSSSGDGGSNSGDGDASAEAATPTLSYTAVKGFTFTWTDVAGATFYRILENPDGASGFTQVGDDIGAGEQTVTLSVPLYARVNAQYILQSCNTASCVDAPQVTVSQLLNDSIGYVKASNTDAGDGFGNAVSLSADANTMAVGAFYEESDGGGDQADNSSSLAGAVYVFTRSGTDWRQQAYIKASNADDFDFFGQAISLSADGNTLAVGANGEASNAIGIDGIQTDNSASDAGAVYVFTRSGTTWSQQAYIKASNTNADDNFGRAVNLSDDGNTLAVGASGEASNDNGIDATQTDNSLADAGAVYVFTRSGSAWSQQAYIKASNTDAADYFGAAVSLSTDGNTLVVGTPGEDSSSTGIGGSEVSNNASGAGAVYVFARNGSSWSQRAYIKASNTDAGDNFGNDVSLSADGNTLAVAARYENSNATGINRNQIDNSASNAGAVYIFTHSGSSWSQQAYIKASNTEAFDYFGEAVSLSADGNRLAVGAYGEASNATGIGGNQTDNDASDSGAVYVFIRSGTNWSQQAYIKASNTDAADYFGLAVSFSGDGNTLAAAARDEASNALGIGGDQTDNSATAAGAVYLY